MTPSFWKKTIQLNVLTRMDVQNESVRFRPGHRPSARHGMEKIGDRRAEKQACKADSQPNYDRADKDRRKVEGMFFERPVRSYR